VFDIGSGELMVILVVALLLFGGRLPEVARGLGRSFADLKRGLSESARPLREAKDEMVREIEAAESRPGGPEMPPPGGRLR
jgi:sec-independent protein translocase protein TatA